MSTATDILQYLSDTEARANAATEGPLSVETVTTSCGVCHKIGPLPYRRDRLNYACIYVDYPGNSEVESTLRATAELFASASVDLLRLTAALRVLVNSQQLSCEMIAQNGLVDVVFELEDALSRAAAIVTKGTNP